jgi:uncharacterized membrane protein YeiB
MTNLAESKVSQYLSYHRNAGLDLARSFAFFGMVGINFWVLMEEKDSLAKWIDTVMGFMQGRAAAMFVVLAGAGISLLSTRANSRSDESGSQGVRPVLLKRALFLFVVGLINCLIWPADILHFYAVYLAIGAVLLSFSSRGLKILAIIPVSVFSLYMLVSHFDRGWDWETISYKDAWYLPGLIQHLFFNGSYPVFPWATFLIIGIWVGRQDLSRRTLRNTLLVLGILAFLFAEGMSWMEIPLLSLKPFGVDPEYILPWLEIHAWEPMPLFLLSAGGSALVVISISLLLAEKWGDRRWLSPFLAVGQLTFTLYVTHTIVGSILLYLLKWLKIGVQFFPIWGAALFSAGALVGSYYWKARFNKGPLEWLIRRFLVFSTLRKTNQQPAAAG